jgi:type I restriction enzyme S subunit
MVIGFDGVIANNLFRLIWNIDKEFNALYWFYSFQKMEKTIYALSGSSSMPAISFSTLDNLNIAFSKNSEEQKKIASCLSSLDKVIAAHRQKLELLKDHKKGLLQNLFPREGEKVPNYRFPEFMDDREWEEKTLDEVAIFLKGKGISKSDIVENGSLPCIRYGELYTHYNETIKTIKSYTNLNADDLVLSQANDVIIPASGETQEDIATASCVLSEGIALGGDLNIIRTKVNGVFLSYFMNNTKKKEIAQLAQGISVVHLYSNQLKTLMISIPKPKEQKKIASCLSSLDELMTANAKKIELLKQHKTGLMQGLFPKNE